MSIQNKLVHALSGFYDVSVNAIDAHFLLNQGRGAGSLGRVKLAGLLKKECGLHLPNIHTIKTYNDLISNLEEPLKEKKPPVSQSVNIEKIMECILNPLTKIGIDIAVISSCPIEDNQFYKDNFSQQEIDYCANQANHREHLAGRWGVKEATLKCYVGVVGLIFSSIDMCWVEGKKLIAFYIDGLKKTPLPFDISISHSGDNAIAMVFFDKQQQSADL